MKLKMATQDIFHIILMLSPVMVDSVDQGYIKEQTLPDAGDVNGAQRLPHYQTVLDISNRHYLQFAVQATNDACLLLSEKQTSNMEYSIDHGYSEICLGESHNSMSMIRLGTLYDWSDRVWTPKILDATTFKMFWASWDESIIKVGRGLDAGGDIFMEKMYNSSTIDIKYLSLFNGYGSQGIWRMNTGVYY